MLMTDRPSASDFQVAIICALRVEANAIQAVFDEFLEGKEYMIPKAEHDTNAYTTGKIGRHNVVLAHMSDYGNVNSANVTANLRHTFPAVRVAFIVGVCAGAPKTLAGVDIFLGDVIISTGIVQYDLGRELPDEFRVIHPEGGDYNRELKGHLNSIQTPRAIWNLKRQTVAYLADESPTPGDIKPKHLGFDKDKLFKPNYRHKHHKENECEICDRCLDDVSAVCLASGEADCETLGCDQLVVRERRNTTNGASSSATSTDLTAPNIHFGLIGSASRVLQSATKRDELVQKYKLIGFEMEGAGAWGTIPCYVIKGVYNYADTHKNKTWQGYAAATAAACFKAFLEPWREVVRNVQMPGANGM